MILVALLVCSTATAGVVDGTTAVGDDRFLPDELHTLAESDAASVDSADGTAGDDTAGATPRDGTVRVGVVGSAFDPDHNSVARRVEGHRRLGGGPFGLQRTSGTSHDTAVAEIVAERSPSARLYLASVGASPTPDRYATAVDWLLANDVDVIVDAGSYFPRTDDAVRQFERVAGRAAGEGAVFVTSAGNYAERHWRGRVSDPGWVAFDRSGTTRNPLGEGVTDGRVTLRLYWEGDANYDLYVYRRVPGGPDELVASSTRDAGSVEAVDTRLSSGEYYVRVYGHGGTGTVDLFAARTQLGHTTATGSALPPATVDGVVSVGAVTDAGRVEPYSSDGEDVSAIDAVDTDAAGRFEGTSAAAPVVAGTVSTMVAHAGSDGVAPARVEEILRETADGRYDRVDPDQAVARARNATAGAPS